jgi:hypothetical protein
MGKTWNILMIDLNVFYCGTEFASFFTSLVFLKEISKRSANGGVYNET